MADTRNSLLLIGESYVGKTHYGAQLLRRLDLNEGALKLRETPTSIRPYESAMEKLSMGLAADHTPGSVYNESVWRVEDQSGNPASLIWPDYGGEQIKTLIETKRLPQAWRRRIIEATGWVLLVRPSHIPLPNDALTRSTALPSNEEEEQKRLSPQSRLVDLLQMLLFVKSVEDCHHRQPVPLAILLSCFDELDTSAAPASYLAARIPMIDQMVRTHWPETHRQIYGLSALGRPLSKDRPDQVFAEAGPETSGYVIDESGERSLDLTRPLQWLISQTSSR